MSLTPWTIWLLEEVHFFLEVGPTVDLRATEDELITFLEGRAAGGADETRQVKNLCLQKSKSNSESNNSGPTCAKIEDNTT